MLTPTRVSSYRSCVATVQKMARTFPWRSLESLQRGDVSASNTLKRALSGIIDLSMLTRVASEMLGVSASARWRKTATHLAGTEAGVAIKMMRSDDAAQTPFFVELELALASALVTRVMKRSGPRIIDPAKAASAPIAGAVGAILVAAARRAGAPLKILDAGSSSALLSRDSNENRIVASFTVVVEYEAYVAHVIVAADDVALVPSAAWNRRGLEALGDLRLKMPIVASSSIGNVAELGSLRVGDAWMPRDVSIRRKSGRWSGDVALVAERSEQGVRAELAFDDIAGSDRLVLRERKTFGWSAVGGEEEMVDKDALIESVGEVPVVVRVEIGSVEMSAREWAALASGDVISLGVRVGELVSLRASGVEIARGELVEIEGEVGVRITSRSGSR